jgi:MFS family permease
LKSKYFYGYNIVAAGFLIQAVCIGAMFTYGVFFKEFQVAFGWSRALISGASSLAFLVMGAAGVLAGGLNDRIGPRLIVMASGASLGLGYLLMSQLSAPWQLYVLYGILVGVGFATHDVITLSTVTRWFVKRRGAMSGFVKVGTGFGQLVVPLAAAALIAALGWRNAYLVIGAVALATMLAVAQLMRRDPQQMGLHPDGGHHETGRSDLVSAGNGLNLKAAARTWQFWIICIAEFAVFFCMFTVIVHIVPHARDQGLQPAAAAAVISTIGGVSMIGRVVMGAACDRIGGKRSLMVCFIIMLCSILWLQVAASAWMLFAFAVIYGFAHGGFFTVMSPTVAELFGTGSHGLLFGLVLFSGTLGGALGPLLTGSLFDATGSYRTAFVMLTTLVAAGFVLISFLRPLGAAGSAPLLEPQPAGPNK